MLTPEPPKVVIIEPKSKEPETVTSPPKLEHASEICRDSSSTGVEASSFNRIYMLTLVTSSPLPPMPSILPVPLESMAPTFSTSSMALIRSIISSDTCAVCSRVESSGICSSRLIWALSTLGIKENPRLKAQTRLNASSASDPHKTTHFFFSAQPRAFS